MSTAANQLENEIDWRIAELGALRIQVLDLKEGSIAFQASLRALWAMLYAHYEGFCKFALDLYLEELEREGINRSLLHDGLLALSLEKTFKELRGNMARNAILQFLTNIFPVALSDKAKFPLKLETNSNLWPNLLSDNCKSAGLEIDSVDNHSAKLRALVGRRNEIAHGKKNIIKTVSEYVPYEKAVTDVMYELSIAITESLGEKKYLKINIPA